MVLSLPTTLRGAAGAEAPLNGTSQRRAKPRGLPFPIGHDTSPKKPAPSRDPTEVTATSTPNSNRDCGFWLVPRCQMVNFEKSGPHGPCLITFTSVFFLPDSGQARSRRKMLPLTDPNRSTTDSGNETKTPKGPREPSGRIKDLPGAVPRALGPNSGAPGPAIKFALEAYGIGPPTPG